ncbi:MAG: peptide-N(4)-(N-acetyl-beta-glucosaminyl)asparagine amidase [Proteobacteria bacterium]|nr:peptide-N(4)-(N-acetyl-beta-glucosaminyl)asparagine amidase [Pseudomonadota bacterium]
MSSPLPTSHRAVFLLAAAVLPLIAAAAAPPPPIIGPVINIGEQGVATAEPLVPVPPTTPCVVQLYTADSATGTFDDYSAHPFSYSPPAACTGPWYKVVFKADFNVTAGTQYDRTASVWLGGVNVYFGTTQEPGGSVSPSWHVERDVTGLAALFKTAQSGNAIVYNVYNSTYNGSITGSAELDFYPATPDYPAPKVADTVLSLGSDPVGNYSTINTDGTPLSKTFTLPTNVERAFLDVIAQPQSGDEFWYTCGPEQYVSVTGCGGTGFREAEITIDGGPAGFVPISPWIFTGGIDPYLWRPVTGVQTLDFDPFTVDLTPFAGMLDDGNPHTIAVSVVTGDPAFQNNGQYFSTSATLRLFQDARSSVVTGGLIGPVQDSGVHPVSKAGNKGSVYDMNVASGHDFAARGYVDTSHGRVATAVSEKGNFNNHDVAIDSSTKYAQNITVQSGVVTTTTRNGRLGSSRVAGQWYFPLKLSYTYALNPDGSSYQLTTVDQNLQTRNLPNAIGVPQYLGYQDSATDTLQFDASGNFTGNTGQSAQQSYLYKDSQRSTSRCYNRTVQAAGNAVTAVIDGAHCPS